MVLLETDPPVAVITLNRPERHNSLVPALLEDLLEALAEVHSHPDLQVLVLQAKGRSFSTGGDLHGFAEHLDSLGAYAAQLVGLLNQVILAMLDLPIPIVAAVQGAVTGGSLGLVLGSDLVLASLQASFTPYYSLVGFSPDGGWTALLPAVIGVRRVSAALLTNHTITAQEALDWGLVHRLVPGDQLQAAAQQAASRIAVHQPGSMAATKRLLREGLTDAAERLERERAQFVDIIQTQATRRTMLHFLEELKKK